jgi:hypothetical protein
MGNGRIVVAKGKSYKSEGNQKPSIIGETADSIPVTKESF